MPGVVRTTAAPARSIDAPSFSGESHADPSLVVGPARRASRRTRCTFDGHASSSEHPLGTTPAPQPAATYGLCSGPQNADAFPSSPVPNVETQCEFTQQFHSTSPNASYGGSCGGYTVAFGPQGDLKRKRKYLWLKGEWADAQLTTQAACTAAHIAAASWGYLCTNAACTTGAWERIGTASSKTGYWNTNTNTCTVAI